MAQCSELLVKLDMVSVSSMLGKVEILSLLQLPSHPSLLNISNIVTTGRPWRAAHSAEKVDVLSESQAGVLHA